MNIICQRKGCTNICELGEASTDALPGAEWNLCEECIGKIVAFIVDGVPLEVEVA